MSMKARASLLAAVITIGCDQTPGTIPTEEVAAERAGSELLSMGSLSDWQRADQATRRAALEDWARIMYPQGNREHWRRMGMELDHCTKRDFLAAKDGTDPNMIIARCERVMGYR